MLRIPGEEFDLLIGVASKLSSSPAALVAWLAIVETTSKDDPSIASPVGKYGCDPSCPLRRGTDDAAEFSLEWFLFFIVSASFCNALDQGSVGGICLSVADILLA